MTPKGCPTYFLACWTFLFHLCFSATKGGLFLKPFRGRPLLENGGETFEVSDRLCGCWEGRATENGTPFIQAL
jgi:hypothetical protein